MTKPLPTPDQVCAVIVTYHPDRGLTERARLIRQQIDALVIVDNHSADAERGVLRDTARSLPAVLIENPDNRGIAAALNQGIRWANDHGYAWVLTFDQDSRAHADLAATLCTVVSQFPRPDRLGAVGANYFDPARRRLAIPAGEPSAQDWIETPTVITSGMLLSLAAWHAVGPFREDFFIDAVDIEYCLRLQAHGYSVIASREALMDHAVGHPTWHRFLWKRVACSNHPPLRRYYITRNRLILARETWRTDKRWALAHLRGVLNHCVLALLYEDRRWQKLQAILTGVWHAGRRRAGKLPRVTWQ